MYKCKYFRIEELVSQDVYNYYGEGRCWQFFNPDLLKTIDDIREHFNKPITINTWLWGGLFHQRGLRANLDGLVVQKTNQGKYYISEHCLGRAVDFDVEGYTAEKVRQEIFKNKDKFPHIRRIEDNVNWIHIDLKPTDYDGIYLFKP